MAPKQGGARKGAAGRKSARKTAADAAQPGDPNSLLEGKGDEARDRAQMDEALGGNILGSEPLGPSTEHEDHEGGKTDSLAKKGVRIVPREDGQDEEQDEEAAVVRAPSVRERQLRRGAIGGNVRGLDAVAALQAANNDKETEVVRVVATGPGFYGNKRRHRGDVFDYRLTEAEEGLLPMWLEAADGSIPTRRRGETVGVPESTILEVHPTGGVSVREGARTTTTATGVSGRAGVGSRAAGTRSVAGARTAAAPAASGRKSSSRSSGK